MIRKARQGDIEAILQLTKSCAKDMIDKQIFQWNDHYPNRIAFENDVKRGELFVLEIKTKIIGCIVISTKIDNEYIPIQWLTKNSNNMYIHRLAVLPKFQGKGYARKLMDFAEKSANEQKFYYVRLDTFSQNKRNQIFYELRGYQRLGTIFFPKQSEHPFYCYELIL